MMSILQWQVLFSNLNFWPKFLNAKEEIEQLFENTCYVYRFNQIIYLCYNLLAETY